MCNEFAFLIEKCLVAPKLQPRQILRVHKFEPILARYLGGALGQAENARAARRQFDKPRIKFHDKRSDPPGLTGEFELRVALSQSELRLLALGDIGTIADHADRLAGGLVIEGATNG